MIDLNSALYRMRITAAAAIAGAAASGVLLYRAGLPFDRHIPGALMGAAIALLNWTRIPRT